MNGKRARQLRRVAQELAFENYTPDKTVKWATFKRKIYKRAKHLATALAVGTMLVLSSASQQWTPWCGWEPPLYGSDC